MGSLKITTIITTHHRPGLLIRALKSLAAERRKFGEILVVEDGEDPSMASLLRATGVPCRLVQRKLHSVAKARNLGLQEAHSDWVIFLDDDDIVYPDRLEKLEAAAVHSGAGFVFGSTLKVTPGRRFPVPTKHPEGEGVSNFADILRCMPHTNSTLISRKALLDCGGFVEASTYFSDWCAFLHMVDHASSAWRIPHLLSEFEAGEGGMTHDVARGNGMKAKVLEAFDLLNLQQEENQQILQKVRLAVEQAEPFSSYDSYVDLADRALSDH
ncbi:MAG: glycosyltransferase family 2 protein [Holophagaceae bacterium]|nr:glycosyltransferase family 2 protein [Holophagaceae bacterium]